jgi:hypothetical protein
MFKFDDEFEPEVEVDSRHEVPLAALVTTRKPRKGRGMCCPSLATSKQRSHNLVTEGDFEFVPHVRPVIVLDDVMTPDVEVDEPWEHVYGNDDEYPDKDPSYATIASFN